MEKKPFLTLQQVQEIAKTYPTPFHIYDEKAIRENARRVKAAFAWNPGFKEYFAVKATPTPAILKILREMMRCDVLEEPFRREFLIGLSHKELREHSHNPMKYYNVKQMVLPDYTLGRAYALLNQLRAAVRETEVAAAAAFHEGKTYTREDIIEELNRMSSAMHIVMCKYLAGEYKKD